jgi:hypothetical protein
MERNKKEKKVREKSGAAGERRRRKGPLFSLFPVDNPRPSADSFPAGTAALAAGPATGAGGRVDAGREFEEKFSYFLFYISFVRDARERERQRLGRGGVICFLNSFSRFSPLPHNHVQSKKIPYPPPPLC